MTAGRRQAGFAVALALYMLTAIAGIAAIAFHTVAEARRAASRSTRQEEATSASETGLYDVLEGWDVARRDSMAIGAIDSSTPVLTPPTRRASRTFVIRLTSSLFWVASAGEADGGTSVDATRNHSLLLEVLRPEAGPRGALVSGGNVVASGQFSIDGHDAIPPGWSDCPPADTIPAPSIVAAEGVAAVFDDGRPLAGVHVDGAAAAMSTYESLGRVSASALAARASVTVAPGAILSPTPETGDGCQSHAQSDWGEPVRRSGADSCERFFPVVHAAGDLTVRKGRGQGILLVSGRLRIEGPFLFHGVVVTRGGMDVTGPDVRIYGSVLSAGPMGVILRGDGALRRSSCAVAHATNAAARAYPVPLRAWSELY